MLIGIDLDGVVCDAAGGIIRWAQQRLGIRIHRRQITSYGIENCTPLTRRHVDMVFGDPDFYRRVTPVRGAIGAIRLLYRAGACLHMVTSRPPWTLAATEEWLRVHRVPYHGLSLVDAADKLAYARRERLDVFVEDRLDTALSLAGYCRLVVLMDQPWNRADFLPPNVRRCAGWRQALSTILEGNGHAMHCVAVQLDSE